MRKGKTGKVALADYAPSSNAQMKDLWCIIESWRSDNPDITEVVDADFQFNQINADWECGAASGLAGRAEEQQPASSSRRAAADAALELEHRLPMADSAPPAERTQLLGLVHGDSEEAAMRKYLAYLFGRPMEGSATWQYNPHTQGKKPPPPA